MFFFISPVSKIRHWIINASIKPSQLFFLIYNDLIYIINDLTGKLIDYKKLINYWPPNDKNHQTLEKKWNKRAKKSNKEEQQAKEKRKTHFKSIANYQHQNAVRISGQQLLFKPYRYELTHRPTNWPKYHLVPKFYTHKSTLRSPFSLKIKPRRDCAHVYQMSVSSASTQAGQPLRSLYWNSEK